MKIGTIPVTAVNGEAHRAGSRWTKPTLRLSSLQRNKMMLSGERRKVRLDLKKLWRDARQSLRTHRMNLHQMILPSLRRRNVRNKVQVGAESDFELIPFLD